VKRYVLVSAENPGADLELLYRDPVPTQREIEDLFSEAEL
jgi:hypothetical protein